MRCAQHLIVAGLWLFPFRTFSFFLFPPVRDRIHTFPPLGIVGPGDHAHIFVTAVCCYYKLRMRPITWFLVCNQTRKWGSMRVFCDKLFSPMRCRNQAKTKETTKVMSAVLATCGGAQWLFTYASSRVLPYYDSGDLHSAMPCQLCRKIMLQKRRAAAHCRYTGCSPKSWSSRERIWPPCQKPLVAYWSASGSMLDQSPMSHAIKGNNLNKCFIMYVW